MLSEFQPIVLCGGRSRRFGRDKLREVLAAEGELLIDRPIAALRGVFGRRVWLVGDCDERVKERGDRHVADRWPGAGPMGGIATGLRESGGAVMVLAGDLAEIGAEQVRTIGEQAGRASGADAVIAKSDRVQPCIGVYRWGVLEVMEEAIGAGRLAMMEVIERLSVELVELPREACLNVNTAEDLVKREASWRAN